MTAFSTFPISLNDEYHINEVDMPAGELAGTVLVTANPAAVAEYFAGMAKSFVARHAVTVFSDGEPRVCKAAVWLRWYRMQQVKIECPDCGAEQVATVTHDEGAPFPVYAHVCIGCGCVITESEWIEVDDQRAEDERQHRRLVDAEVQYRARDKWVL